MRHRTDRREFMKIMGGAALAPCLFRSAEAAAWGFAGAFQIPQKKLVLAANPIPNQPIGVAQGLHAGRVVWAHDPKASDWEGPGHGHWWEDSHTNQAVVDRMMSGAIQTLGGKATDAKAWDALIRYFNQTHGNGNVGYKKGEKVTIKVNLVGCIVGWGVNPRLTIWRRASIT